MDGEHLALDWEWVGRSRGCGLASKHWDQRGDTCDHTATSAGLGEGSAGMQGAGAVGTGAVTDSAVVGETGKKGGALGPARNAERYLQVGLTYAMDSF